jgi:hypothetical protein
MKLLLYCANGTAYDRLHSFIYSGLCSVHLRGSIIIHFLGLAPAGYLAAPDNGATRRYTVGCSQIPETRHGCLAVPLNAAESGVTENLRGGKKITTQVLEGLPRATHVSVCPEPVTPRKPPAPLAFFRARVSIGGETCVSGLSCPFFRGGAFALDGWSAGACGGAAAFVRCLEIPTAGTAVTFVISNGFPFASA